MREIYKDTGISKKSYYFGARYYDPKISSWLSTDPILGSYFGSSPNRLVNGGVFRSMNLNPYNYTAQNPLNRIDPDGRHDEPSFGAMNKYYDSKVNKETSCINYHRKGLEKLLSKKLRVTDNNAIQKTDDGRPGLREAMHKKGLASKHKDFGTFKSKIKSVANTTDLSGLGEFIQANYTFNKTGKKEDLYDVYGVSMAAGYHSLTIAYTEREQTTWEKMGSFLTGGDTSAKVPVFTLYDQYSKGVFSDPSSLNNAILRKYPVNDHPNYKGVTGIHKIYNK